MNDFDSGKSYNGCAQDGWDVMEIIVRDSSSDSGVALKNVMLSFDMIAYPRRFWPGCESGNASQALKIGLYAMLTSRRASPSRQIWRWMALLETRLSNWNSRLVVACLRRPHFGSHFGSHFSSYVGSNIGSHFGSHVASHQQPGRDCGLT